ncbi:DUF6266 family protein, partial [Parapedobacter sp. DT-150]|uniref:DUF6266 family protein n=1 Tax=Parapedobacter sp. DT-150 TaxID=3396162 RepID=UPI003F1B3B0F
NKAVAGEFPDYTIDYANVTVAQGGLGAPASLLLAQTGPEEVTLSWDPITSRYTSFADDELVVVLYNATKRFMNVYDGTQREAASMAIAVPASFAGDELVAWGFMVHRDGDRTSDSQYAGTVMLAGGTAPEPEP